MDSRLPVPVAGYDYAPKMGSPLSDNRYWSGWVGYQSELNLANDIARTPNQVVVKYGAGDGTHGAISFRLTQLMRLLRFGIQNFAVQKELLVNLQHSLKLILEISQ